MIIKKRFLFLLLPAGVAILLSLKLLTKSPALTEVKGAESSNLIAVEGVKSPNTSQYQAVTISHTVEEGDTLFSVAKKYHADAQTILDYPYNQIDDSLTLKVGQILIVPNGYIDSPPPTIAPVIGSGALSHPVSGELTITQYSSWFHSGAIDIAVSLGTPVKAAANGRVTLVEKLTTGYGWHVIIDHGNGLTSLYGHLSRIDVTQGMVVNRGDQIGLSGSTGRSTGPHLHFETKQNGQPVDPLSLL